MNSPAPVLRPARIEETVAQFNRGMHWPNDVITNGLTSTPIAHHAERTAAQPFRATDVQPCATMCLVGDAEPGTSAPSLSLEMLASGSPQDMVRTLTDDTRRRVRYFHVVSDAPETDLSDASSTIILAADSLGSERTAQQGLRIAFRHTVVGRCDPEHLTSRHVVIEHSESHEFVSDDFLLSCELQDRGWTEILVMTNRSAGLLVLDGPAQFYTPPEGASLLNAVLIARWILGWYLNPALQPETKNIVQDDGPFDRIRRGRGARGRKSSRTAEVAQAYDLLHRARVDARSATAALFRYEWQTGQLIKEYEEVGLDGYVGKLAESYPVGRCYTGKAWLKAGRRAVSDLGLLHSRGLTEPDLDRTSFERHNRLFENMGGIRAVQYERLAELSGSYLVRLMNRLDEPVMSFHAVRQRLDKTLSELDGLLSSMAAGDLARDLGWLASAATLAPLEVKGLRDAAASVLRRRSISGVAYGIWQGETVQIWPLSSELTASRQSPISDLPLDHVKWNGTRRVLFAGDMDEELRRALPQSEGYLAFAPDALSATASRIGDVVCVVFAPIELSLQFGDTVERRLDIEDLIVSQVSDLLVLDALPGLLAMAHNTARFWDSGADYGAGFARYLHHELMSRLVRLAETAVSALTLAAAEVGRSSPEVADEIDTRAHSVSVMREEILRVLRPADLISGNSIELDLRPFSVEQLIREAAQEAGERFSRQLMQERRLSNYVVWAEIPAQRQDVDVLVGDRILVKQALVALIDNAIKYSNPRYPYLQPGRESDSEGVLRAPRPGYKWVHLRSAPDRPLRGSVSIIEVSAISLPGTVDFRVRNWGVPMPEPTEPLWYMFNRAGVQDPRRDIAGLGLGLFLVRLAGDSHDGNSKAQSTPTLNDERRRRLEGFDTVVSFSVSRSLEPGPVLYSAKDRDVNIGNL